MDELTATDHLAIRWALTTQVALLTLECDRAWEQDEPNKHGYSVKVRQLQRVRDAYAALTGEELPTDDINWALWRINAATLKD